MNFGSFDGQPSIDYNVFRQGLVVSRPIRPDLFISDIKNMEENYAKFENSLNFISQRQWQNDDIDRATKVIYTSVMSFACCYDIWKRTSRKTPGTFFEILMAGFLLSMLPNAKFSKHIPLPVIISEIEQEGQLVNVSTDLVIRKEPNSDGIVVPLKITTRERIVQPFAHQRILDAAFGEGKFKSFLVCISETQLDNKTRSVKQVCVPGTIKLYQQFLAPLHGLYYCDLPQRYNNDDIRNVIPVNHIGQLFIDILHSISPHC